MLIAVYTCAAYRPTRVQTQIDTWIPRLEADGYQVEIFDGQRLGVPDGYRELPQKTRALVEWAFRHGHDSLLKIDDDGAINPKTFRPVEHDYAGIRIKANDYGNPAMGVPTHAPRTFPHDYASGGAYWLSRKAMQAILDTPFVEDFAEDRLVGHALASNGIKLTELEGYGFCSPTSAKWIIATQLYPSAIRELY